MLPVVALVLAVGGLGVAFRRWRRELATPPPDDDDRALVAAALAARHETDEPVAVVDEIPEDSRIGESGGR